MKYILLKTITFLEIFLVISLLIAFMYTKIYLDSIMSTKPLLFIPKGSTLSVVTYLQKEGYDVGKFDYYLLKMFGYPQAGWINLGSDTLSRWDFFYKITHSKAATKNLTLIPGETKEIFFDIVAEKFDLNSTKLLNAYIKLSPSNDGVIFADTYSFPLGVGEDKLIEFLVNKSLKKHKKLSQKLLKSYNESEWFGKYVTISSIIQKEAGSIEEMPLVSAVIYNRLKKGMKLQMDGTLNYGKNSHRKVTSSMIKEDKSLFNSYKNIGLPPFPICAVSKESINAALNPASVSYLYFVRGKNGKHIFTNTYKEHLKNIK